MALEKKVTYDYEVRGEFKCIQQRAKTAIEEDGVEIDRLLGTTGVEQIITAMSDDKNYER